MGQTHSKKITIYGSDFTQICVENMHHSESFLPFSLTEQLSELETAQLIERFEVMATDQVVAAAGW